MPSKLLVQHERFNRRIAEFSDAETEHRFRQWQHFSAVRQARLALLLAISLIALFLISDYFLLPGRHEFIYAMIIRSLIFATGLITIIIISRAQDPALFDRALFIFQAFTITLLLFVLNFLKPDPGSAVLSLVTLSLGMYLFVPNRFIVATTLSFYLACGFFGLALLTRLTDNLQLLQWGIIIISVNLIGSAFCYRIHLVQRRGFLELMRERFAREALQSEIARRTELEEKLLYQAHTDELTGANNRRYFMQLGREEISRSLRYDRPLSLLLLDLDHFKAINDKFGHDTGDEVLRSFSWLCRRTLREPDILGRLGGEEFAVLIPEESINGALKTAERLRAAVEEEFATTPYHLTVSIGVTEMQHSDSTISDLLKRADAMMYEAKHQGRNRVVAAAEIPMKNGPGDPTPPVG
jgi:diguanylate cyclase (GGDEF)-like protein